MDLGLDQGLGALQRVMDTQDLFASLAKPDRGFDRVAFCKTHNIFLFHNLEPRIFVLKIREEEPYTYVHRFISLRPKALKAGRSCRQKTGREGHYGA